eukprot:313180-Chlamydomonas_euryale.AAC.8
MQSIRHDADKHWDGPHQGGRYIRHCMPNAELSPGTLSSFLAVVNIPHACSNHAVGHAKLQFEFQIRPSVAYSQICPGTAEPSFAIVIEALMQGT